MNTPAPAAKDPAPTTNGPTQQIQPKGMSVLRQRVTPALDITAPTNKESAIANEQNSAPDKGPTTTATPATDRSAPTATSPSTPQYVGPKLVGKGTSQEECSAETIMPYPMAACDHPATCCKQNEDKDVDAEGLKLWRCASDYSSETFRQCQHCAERLYRCPRRRDIHQRGCNQRPEPQGRPINLTLQTNAKTEEAHCTHPEIFCPNGLLLAEGRKKNTCGTCGEKLETDVPPCKCCCHKTTCGGRSSCLEPTCNESEQIGLIPAEMRRCGERKAREMQQQPVSPMISLESLSSILTIVINQAKTDFQSDRLCYTQKGKQNIWAGADACEDRRNTAKAEQLRNFIISLPEKVLEWQHYNSTQVKTG